MTLTKYIDMMERAADELDREAGDIEAEKSRRQSAPGRYVDLRI